jgi:hypothetical protein
MPKGNLNQPSYEPVTKQYSQKENHEEFEDIGMYRSKSTLVTASASELVYRDSHYNALYPKSFYCFFFLKNNFMSI